MAHFDAQIKDLFVVEAIAGETTMAAFQTGASVKEIQVFDEAGLALPSGKGTICFMNKKANGSVVTSDMIYGPNITRVTKTAPVTEVPGYNSFTMNITGASVGSLAEVFVWAYDYSPADWRFKTIPYTIGSTVLLTEAAGLCKQITRNLASDYYYGNPPTFVFNKAGYKAVYATGAEAYADISNLTNGDLVWVIANGKAYTYTAAGAATFAGKFPEKTNWSSEITAGTAELLSQPKFYDVVLTAASKIYIIDKPQTYVEDKFDGEAAVSKIGAVIKNPLTNTLIKELSTAPVGAVRNPGAGKRISALEYHLFKQHGEPGGIYDYNAFPFTPDAVKTTDYTTLTIDYIENPLWSGISRPIAGRPEGSTIILAFATEAHANTILGYINLAKDGAALTLGDLADVDLTTAAPTDNQVLSYDAASETWVPANDATA